MKWKCSLTCTYTHIHIHVHIHVHVHVHATYMYMYMYNYMYVRTCTLGATTWLAYARAITCVGCSYRGLLPLPPLLPPLPPLLPPLPTHPLIVAEEEVLYHLAPGEDGVVHVGRIRQCKARQAHVSPYHLITRGKREHVHTCIHNS